MNQLILPTQTFKDDVDALAVVEHSQEIPDEFLANNQALRDASSAPAGDWMKVASIPTAVIEKWWREGVDINNMSAKEIVRRLSNEDLGAFITTNKRI